MTKVETANKLLNWGLIIPGVYLILKENEENPEDMDPTVKALIPTLTKFYEELEKNSGLTIFYLNCFKTYNIFINRRTP